jgi:hypothetical protein
MPQLDLYSLSNQFFWGFLFFGLFYYLVTYYIIPSVFSILYARNFFSSKLSADSIALVSFCFGFSAVSSVFYSDFFYSLNNTLESIYFNKMAYSIVLSELFNFELGNLYDLHYFNDDE